MLRPMTSQTVPQYRKVQAWKIVQAPSAGGLYTRSRTYDTLYTEAEAVARLNYLTRSGILNLSIKTALVRESL